MKKKRNFSLAFSYLLLFKLVENQRCGETVQSENGLRLSKASYQVSQVSGVGECTMKCFQDPRCQSYNLRMSALECMLLESNHLTATLTRTDDDWVFMANLAHPCFTVKCKKGGSCVRTADNGTSCVYCTSCSSLLQQNPGLRNGYYRLNVSGSISEMYCDMETRGGGWTLVSSVSGSSKNHLRQSALCHNNTICVPHQGMTASVITAQKRSDDDIRALVAADGVFRVDVIKSSPYTVYFKLPSGANLFSSTCTGSSCPRIVTSHSYPYNWESSPCTGTSRGYHIQNSCYYVFDNHDNDECGTKWFSTKYYLERVLYGFCQANGIYSGLRAYMYI